jgi:multidrug transporter EmrE-like cation transporter
MTFIYQGITMILILLIGWNLFREKRLVEQMVAAIVLIPLILRVLMIK